jgi:hypothetical protein
MKILRGEGMYPLDGKLGELQNQFDTVEKG